MNFKEELTFLLKKLSIRELRLAQDILDEVWYKKHLKLTEQI